MIHIVLNVVRILNYSPTEGGISNALSPKTIMSGETLDYKKNLCLKIVQYFQVHEEDPPHNIQTTSTRGAICIGPSVNLQCGFKFLALNSAKTMFGGAGTLS